MASQNVMSYKLLSKFVRAELRQVLAGREQRFSYLVEGPHGIGKSAFWKEICLDEDGFFGDLRLGQRDLGDIIGLPVAVEIEGEQHMIHIKPELIRNFFVKDLSELGTIGDENDKLRNERPKDRIGKPYKFVLAFLDEYNRGTKDVQQAVFELVYDRSMNGDRVHPKCLIAAACNDNLEIYTITESDPAFRSRFKTIKYAPTVTEWLDWGAKKNELNPDFIEVFKGNPAMVDPPKGKDADWLNQPHPNRRSWHEYSQFYTQFVNDFTEVEMRDIGATFVGRDSAEMLRSLLSSARAKNAKGRVSASQETEKVEKMYHEFIKLHTLDKKQAANQMSNWTPSDFQAFTDFCITKMTQFNYATGTVKDRVIDLTELLPNEFFAQIWKGINGSRFHASMLAHVGLIGKPDLFKPFEK